MRKKDIVGDAQFRVMCDMWGVDDAIKALSRMGMGVTADQVEAERKKETEKAERFSRALRKED